MPRFMKEFAEIRKSTFPEMKRRIRRPTSVPRCEPRRSTMRTISGTRPSSIGWQLVGTSDRDSLASASPCCATSSDHTYDEVIPR